ncbi:MAG: N-acetylmuramic acid 6-phosphate etherase [Candidatus Caldipriscus sp.]
MNIYEVLREISILKTESKEISLNDLSPKEIVELSVKDNIYGLLKVLEYYDKIIQISEIWAESLRNGGRVVMVGAGTSGRLGIMESAELFPTFGIGKDRVMAFIAGGKGAVFSSREGAEDRYFVGKALVSRLKLSRRDLLIGISASGRTPFVKGAIDRAKEMGCKTVLISTNSEDRVKIRADINLCVDVGSEILPGSTRMKSATVQKVILNTISLLGAVFLEKIRRGRMVDMVPLSGKLKARAVKTLMEEFGISGEEAEEILNSTNWSLKEAFKILEERCR